MVQIPHRWDNIPALRQLRRAGGGIVSTISVVDNEHARSDFQMRQCGREIRHREHLAHTLAALSYSRDDVRLYGEEVLGAHLLGPYRDANRALRGIRRAGRDHARDIVGIAQGAAH